MVSTKLPARIALVALALSAVACRRLPETIPYQANLLERGGENGVYRITELVGAELVLDGRTVGKVVESNSKVTANVAWSGPKSELRPTLNGKYAIKVGGPCGPFDIPAEGPPPNWTSLSDSDIAKNIKTNKAFPIYLDIKMPPKHVIYVDRGAATGTLKIGPVTIEKGRKAIQMMLGGCAGQPTVTLDGAPLGVLDASAKANLITLEPSVCHGLYDVAYGDRQKTRPATLYPAKAVVSLSERPAYVLESAPSSLKLQGGGTVTTELLRTRCQ